MAQAAESEVALSRPAAATAAAIDVEVHSGFESLPEPLAQFFAAAGAANFFQSIPWYRTMLRTAGPEGDKPRIYAATRGGRPLAALVARERKHAGKLKTHMLLAPSRGANASLFAPLVATEDGRAGLFAIAAAIARSSPPFHVLRFDCLDPSAPEFAVFAAAFRAAHMPVQAFFNFHNYYDDVSGQDLGQYLAHRPPELKQDVERAARLLARGDRARFAVIDGGPELEAALIDYALVDLQSWKEPEFYADCTPELIRAAAAAGALRLGLLHLDGALAAAQIWLVAGGRATIWRHHYAQKFAKHRPGAALTFAMFRHALASGDLREIDFGPGDEPFKGLWLSRRRERAGLIAFNPRTAKGLAAAARHFGGRAGAVLAPTLRAAIGRWSKD
ncbi:MAG TPA: GNAT family N-acetyltransferase [Stellaceae bacterium]|nr:GNAT family N-acetyltransferase [Stellaceae bacterium]